MEKYQNINILYEDNHLLVVVKPQNIPVCPDSSKDKDLLSILKEYLKEKYNKPGNVYLGLVHRLDRPTEGIMVFAKTSKCAERLARQITKKEFKKTYYGLCSPAPIENSGFIDLPIIRKEGSIMERTISPDGINALTEYHVVRTYENIALVKFHLHTGRTHQIRVHTSHCGFPLMGDELYGGSIASPELKLQGQALWAGKMEFIHPVTKEPVTIVDRTPNWWPDETLKP